MRPELENVLVDLGIGDADLRVEVEALLGRYSERYGAVAMFLATQTRTGLDVVLADEPDSLYAVPVAHPQWQVGAVTAVPADDLSLPGRLAGCEMRAGPLTLSDGQEYARLCALFRRPPDAAFDRRFRTACESLQRVIMIHNLRLRYGTASFARQDYWISEVLPDLRLAAATGKGCAMIQFVLVPPLESPPYWLRPEWTFMMANLGFWVRRFDWPPVTRVARHKVESFVVTGVGLDEATCRRAAEAVSRSMGPLLGPRSGSGECMLEVRALLVEHASELIDMGQARCIRELVHSPILSPEL